MANSLCRVGQGSDYRKRALELWCVSFLWLLPGQHNGRRLRVANEVDVIGDRRQNRGSLAYGVRGSQWTGGDYRDLDASIEVHPQLLSNAEFTDLVAYTLLSSMPMAMAVSKDRLKEHPVLLLAIFVPRTGIARTRCLRPEDARWGLGES